MSRGVSKSRVASREGTICYRFLQKETAQRWLEAQERMEEQERDFTQMDKVGFSGSSVVLLGGEQSGIVVENLDI